MIVVGLFTILLLHIFILSKLTFFPYPELFVYTYLTERGLLPYKQILDQHFPGVMFFPLNLASLGVDSPFEMRILSYLVVSVAHIFIFLIGRKLFNNSIYSLLANLFFLIWHPFLEGYVLWIDSFSQLILLAAFYVSLKLKKGDNIVFFTLGLILGVGLLLKQVMGPLILVITVYLWQRFRSSKKFFFYALGGFLPAIYLLYFAFSNNIISDFYYWTVEFNLTTFAEMGRKYVTFPEIVKIFPVFGIGIISIIFAVYRHKIKPILLLTIFFLGSLVFAYARFDFVHLQPALPFSIFLCLLLLNSLTKKHKNIAVFVFILTSVLVVKREYPRLIGGEVQFYGTDEKAIAAKISNITAEGDKIFAFGTLPHIYHMTNTLPPGNIFVFQFPWFMKEAEDRIMEGLLSDPPKVVIRDQTAEVSGINLVNYASKVNGFINSHYKAVYRLKQIEIMVPNKI